jgi:hypothetical protein
MFKVILISFLSFTILLESLLPKGMGISQASIMGDLYSHFLEHNQKGISFEKFLWMHYSSDSKHKKNSEHKKLPSVESQSTFLSIPTFDGATPVLSNSVPNFNEFKIDFNYTNLYNFQYLSYLLNPPRIA